MATDITTTDLADGQHDPARRALTLLPSTTEALVAALRDDALPCVVAGIAKVEHDLRPVPADAVGSTQWRDAIDVRLRKLAVKVLPTASALQTAEWRAALADALSNLPAMISLTAAKRAIHEPFRFIGDIEPVVRRIAADLLDEHQGRLRALRHHRHEIERALNAPPVIAAPDEDRVITPAEIRAMKPEFRALGLKAGFITADQVADAISSGYVPDVKEAA